MPVAASHAQDVRHAATGGALAFTRLGFGGAPLGNMHRVLAEAEAEATVGAAWDAGLRYFDTAPLYGHGLSEARIGRALRRRAARRLPALDQGRPAARALRAGRGGGGIYRGTPPLKVRFDYSTTA